VGVGMPVHDLLELATPTPWTLVVHPGGIRVIGQAELASGGQIVGYYVCSVEDSEDDVVEVTAANSALLVFAPRMYVLLHLLEEYHTATGSMESEGIMAEIKALLKSMREVVETSSDPKGDLH